MRTPVGVVVVLVALLASECSLGQRLPATGNASLLQRPTFVPNTDDSALAELSSIITTCGVDESDWKIFIDSERDLDWEFLAAFAYNMSLCRWESQGRDLWAVEARGVFGHCLTHNARLPAEEHLNCVKTVIESINSAAVTSFSYIFLRIDRAEKLLRNTRRSLEADVRTGKIIQRALQISSLHLDLTTPAKVTQMRAQHISSAAMAGVKKLNSAIEQTEPLFRAVRRIVHASDVLQQVYLDLMSNYSHTGALVRVLLLCLVLGTIHRRIVTPMVSATVGLCFPKVAPHIIDSSRKVLLGVSCMETTMFFYVQALESEVATRFTLAFRLVLLILWPIASIIFGLKSSWESQSLALEAKLAHLSVDQSPPSDPYFHKFAPQFPRIYTPGRFVETLAAQKQMLEASRHRMRQTFFVNRIGFARAPDRPQFFAGPHGPL